MKDGMSLRASAKKVGISLATAFAWRHRFLSKMNREMIGTDKPLTAVSFSMPFSSKGSRKGIKTKGAQTSVMFADKYGNTQLSMIGSEKKVFKLHLLLFSGGNQLSKMKYVKSRFLTQVMRKIENAEILKAEIEASVAKDKTVAVLDWLAVFSGVATKYLQNYWNWHMLVSDVNVKTSTGQNRQLFDELILQN